MTFAMSTEGDSVKSGLSEINDKTVTDNHSTDDSSQDSVESKETSVSKPIENNVASPIDDKPKEESTEGESDHETASKPNDDADTSAEPKMEKSEKEVSEKVEKTEEKSENGKEEPEPKKEDEAKLNDKESKKEKLSSEKEDEEEEEEEEEALKGEEEEKSDKKGVPLLDQPLETTGKRERKNVQRFEEDIKKPESTVVEFEEGKGTALGEIPRVEASITRFKNDDLKYLHKLLFNAVTNKVHFKKNIRKFNGFPFNKDSDDYTKKVDSLKKNEVKVLKTICEILDLSKTGTKEELVEKIMEFLVEPKDSGKPVGGTGRPKRASAVRANNRGLIQCLSVGYSSHDDYSSDERHTSRAKRDKDESSSDEDFKPGDVSEGSDDKPRKRKRGRPRKGGSSDEDEASLTEGSSDESDDAPKTKRRKSITKSNSKSKSKRRGRPTKAAAASAPRAKGRRGRKAKDVSSEEEEEEEEERMDEGSSSEDEPLAKKKAKVNEPPSDDDIKAFIKDVLDGANLEEITMKTVCQRVYDNYPDFDLTARKSFIKSTVKSLIST
ncbi:protein DEK-like isoform X2 [Euwallacea similis]|uniref:protein DEK-like isoform X2 n=1 Tax=Euwallacea similis TaxID=1736056 RepID=UPI00344EED7E